MEEQLLKKTPLYPRHLELGGKIVDFGGWALPVQYTGIIEEHRVVRERAGIFDVSHMGEIIISGTDALDLVQYLITNDAAKLAENQILYSPICYADGGIVDDILVYKLNKDKYILVVNAANAKKDYDWVVEQSKRFARVEVEDVSADYGQIALQGPKSLEILSKISSCNLSGLKYYWFLPKLEVAGVKTMVSRTGYTGEDGFEIYADPVSIVKVFDALMQAGESLGLAPAGLGARDSLRFEAALPLYGHELSDRINPLEARIGYFVALNKKDFIGKTALISAKEKGLTRRLVGLEVEKGIPRQSYTIFYNDRPVGEITSGTYSPTLQKNLGIGYLPVELAQIGQQVEVQVRKRKPSARVVKLPFYKRGANR